MIGAGAHIGNFVEVKKSRIGRGSKANHLAYIGDAIVGKKANIGVTGRARARQAVKAGWAAERRKRSKKSDVAKG